MADIKLLPCPFCGGEDVRFGSVGNSLGIDNYIKCNSCNAKIQICEEYGMRKLINKWNNRATEAEIRAKEYENKSGEARKYFMEIVYDELAGDADNYRANRIIDAFDTYAPY